jgi:hypothetical protein
MSSPFPESILMVRPDASSLMSGKWDEELLQEFERVRERLEGLGIEIFVMDDSSRPASPSAIFSSDPVSFHEDGTIVRYPMADEEREGEPGPELSAAIEKASRFRVRRTIELTEQSRGKQALEGTGSIVFDRFARIAYACRSGRTDIGLFDHICERSGYHPVSFQAFDTKGAPIPHTDRMLSLGNGFALLCEEAIEDPLERKMVKMQLQDSGKEVVPIDRQQMKAFAGNGLQVKVPEKGFHFLLSKRGCDALTEDQLQRIESRTALECLPLDRIESFGERSIGSVLSGIHLPEKDRDKS